MPSILLLDSDRNCLAPVAGALEQAGHTVASFADPASALQAALRRQPDLAIIEFLPVKFDAAEIVRRLRSSHQVPVIMTSVRQDEDSEVIALKLGADDFLRKPVSSRVLIERIKVLLRRRDHAVPVAAPAARREAASVLRRGPLQLDGVKHTCHWKGTPVILTVTEFKILESLSVHFGAVKNRSNLLDVVTEAGDYVDTRTIDSHVKRMRRKFKAIDPTFNLIETVYGAGYKLREAAGESLRQSPEN